MRLSAVLSTHPCSAFQEKEKPPQGTHHFCSVHAHLSGLPPLSPAMGWSELSLLLGPQAHSSPVLRDLHASTVPSCSSVVVLFTIVVTPPPAAQAWLATVRGHELQASRPHAALSVSRISHPHPCEDTAVAKASTSSSILELFLPRLPWAFHTHLDTRPEQRRPSVPSLPGRALLCLVLGSLPPGLGALAPIAWPTAAVTRRHSHTRARLQLNQAPGIPPAGPLTVLTDR